MWLSLSASSFNSCNSKLWKHPGTVVAVRNRQEVRHFRKQEIFPYNFLLSVRLWIFDTKTPWLNHNSSDLPTDFLDRHLDVVTHPVILYLLWMFKCFFHNIDYYLIFTGSKNSFSWEIFDHFSLLLLSWVGSDDILVTCPPYTVASTFRSTDRVALVDEK